MAYRNRSLRQAKLSEKKRTPKIELQAGADIYTGNLDQPVPRRRQHCLKRPRYQSHDWGERTSKQPQKHSENASRVTAVDASNDVTAVMPHIWYRIGLEMNQMYVSEYVSRKAEPRLFCCRHELVHQAHSRTKYHKVCVRELGLMIES